MIRLAAALAAFVTVAFACTEAQAASFAVTKTADTNDGVCDSDCSLREAIVAANGNGQADTITLPAGTYQLTIAGAGENASATGDLDITSDMTITGAGAASTIIDATGLGDRVIEEPPGVLPLPTASISDLTIKGGHPPASTDNGGGVRANGNLNLDRVVVTGNTVNMTGEGGGVVEDGGGTTLVRIRNSLITGNSASVGGGVSENGGATSPTADAGVVIEDSTVSGNIATNPGGGIAGGVAEDGGGDLHIRRSTVSGNTATVSGSFGGGVVTDGGGKAEIVNTTITGNTADGSESYGGGYTEGGGDNVTITNTTIAGNTVTGPGTTPKHLAAGVAQSGAGVVTFKNTIVTGSPHSCGEDTPASGTFTSAGNNIDGDGSCFFTGSGDQPGVDPKLGPLADHGGPTLTLGLLTGSPAIDHGDLAACPTVDQRGVTRPKPAGGACDVGAYERADADLVVTDQLSASRVFVGRQVTDAITVRNAGPNPAGGVTLTEAVPAGLTVVSGGGCSGTRTLSCTLGTLASGQAATVMVALRADSVGQTTWTATVAAAKEIDDPNVANNSATAFLKAVPLAPARGSTVLVAPVKGTVLVSTPLSAAAPTARLARNRAAVKPPRGFSAFVPLRADTLVPVRSLLDTTHGTVRLTTARDTAGASLQSGTFRSGAFTVIQGHSSPLTTLTLIGGGNFATGCRGVKSHGASAARSRPHRSLFANVKGRFSTRGRNSTASVRGTQWLTKDTCAGTLTRVTSGVVVVRDLVKRRTVKVKAHHQYLAKPSRGH